MKEVYLPLVVRDPNFEALFIVENVRKIKICCFKGLKSKILARFYIFYLGKSSILLPMNKLIQLYTPI